MVRILHSILLAVVAGQTYGQTFDSHLSEKQHLWRQTQEAHPCASAEYGINCAGDNHREFCDHDASILSKNIPRSICAPVAALPFLVGEGDYCGRCNLPEGLYVQFLYPSVSPTESPSVVTDEPTSESDREIELAPPVSPPTTQSPVTAAPVTPAPVVPAPSGVPSDAPSGSSLPSVVPSGAPSGSSLPSNTPSDIPSALPSSIPSSLPSDIPSGQPSGSSLPSDEPSAAPVFFKTNPLATPEPSGSSFPSASPSGSGLPSSSPSDVPSSLPSSNPSGSSFPSTSPSGSSLPSSSPSDIPSSLPSSNPSGSSFPSASPSGSSLPSSEPSSLPSGPLPTSNPTASPTPKETEPKPPTENPTANPTRRPDSPVSPPTDREIEIPTIDLAPATPVPVPTAPLDPDTPFEIVRTFYSITFTTSNALNAEELKTFEEQLRLVLHNRWPLNFRAAVVTEVEVLEQTSTESGGTRFLAAIMRYLQTVTTVTLDLEITAAVSPDAGGDFVFADRIDTVFNANKLVLRNFLANQGIAVQFV